jgi:hypothetical protein
MSSRYCSTQFSASITTNNASLTTVLHSDHLDGNRPIMMLWVPCGCDRQNQSIFCHNNIGHWDTVFLRGFDSCLAKAHIFPLTRLFVKGYHKNEAAHGDLAEASDKASLDSLDAEIKELEKTLHNYEQRRSNLLEAMELDEFEKDGILDCLNSIKRLRREGEARLNDLLKTRENLAGLTNAKVKLSQLYDRVLGNLQHSTPEIRALAIDALDIKFYARGTDDVEIQGVIPLELPTTEQTWA